MRVLILGLGQYPKGSGVAAALYFLRRGDDVTVADFYYTKAMDKNIARLKKIKNVRFILGRHATKEIKKIDLVVRHQRIRSSEPELVAARRLGIPVKSELSVFLEKCPAPVIGITGTRGKSTTTALIHAMLCRGTACRAPTGGKTWLGGNILVSPLTFLSKIKPTDIVVLEMSSFQLEGLGDARVSPHIAVWTNLMRDHLNTYPSMKEYAEAKAQIFCHQKSTDTVFLPSDHAFDRYAKQAPGQVYRFGKKGSPEARLVKNSKLKLLGEHNIKNAEAAAAVALKLGMDRKAIKRALESFAGLPDRLETVAIKRGVRYVNDTTATTPDATIAALNSVIARSHTTKQSPRSPRRLPRSQSLARNDKTKLYLIFGGADKELKFDEVARMIKKHPNVKVTLLPGTAHAKIVKAFRSARVSYEDVKDLKAALSFIRQNIKSGDTVLLSPGCASFGFFKNEYDRGEQFKKLLTHF